MGKIPSSTMVDFGIEVPPPDVSRKMQLQEGTKVYCFTRVRNVDGEPLILETSYYPQYIYPNLTRELVQTHNFTASCTMWALPPPRRRTPTRRWCWMRFGRTCWGCPRELRLLPPAPYPNRGRTHL
ncbi:MAG: UTRA domain-containing protein [Oscillospiraceae bacterium]